MSRPTFDATNIGLITDNSLDAASGTHTVPSGTSLLLVFLAGWVVGEAVAEDGDPPTSITWNGASLTRITLSGGWGKSQQGLWYKVNPTAGTSGTISISGGDSDLFDGGIIHCVNLSGVDTAIGTSGIRNVVNTQADSRTTISLSPTTTADDLIIAQWNQQASTTTTGQTYGGTSGTQTVRSSSGFNGDAAFLTTSEPSGSSKTVTFLPEPRGSVPSGCAVSVAGTAASGNPWYYYAQQMRQKLEEKLKRRILIPGFADCMKYGYSR